MPAKESIIGKSFGRLKVLKDGGAGQDGHRMSICICECGTKFIARNSSIKCGYNKSCGCLQKENKGRLGKSQLSHGHCRNRKKSRTYSSWLNMIGRCFDPKNKRYYDYGKRGVKVCKRWMKFENFLADMGECPDGLTIERVKNFRGYFPHNCKWDTQRNQSRNKRTNIMVAISGNRMCLKDACNQLKINYKNTLYRISQGLSPRRAIEIQVKNS